MKLVTVSAGLSKPSSTRMLADRLTEATTTALASAVSGSSTASDPSVEVRTVELRDLAVDIANNLVTGFPSPALRDALTSVSEADGLIVVTPVFAASYSGLFKSFFDLIEVDALTGTPVLLAATGGTARHSLVLEHALRPLFSYLHALTLPSAVFAATDDWGAGADVHAGGLPARISRAGAELATVLSGTRAGSSMGPAPTRQSSTDPASAMTEGEMKMEMDEVIPFAQLVSDFDLQAGVAS
jgi:FMN reductase